MLSQVDLAESIALEFHRDQPYGPGLSYMEGHLLPIMHELIVMGYDDDFTLAASLLHDSVEDTPLTPEGLRRRGMHTEVVETVVALTKLETEDKMTYLGRVAAKTRAIPIKFVDSKKNLQAALEHGPSHPKFIHWLEKYPENLLYLYPLLPPPAELRAA